MVAICPRLEVIISRHFIHNYIAISCPVFCAHKEGPWPLPVVSFATEKTAERSQLPLVSLDVIVRRLSPFGAFVAYTKTDRVNRPAVQCGKRFFRNPAQQPDQPGRVSPCLCNATPSNLIHCPLYISLTRCMSMSPDSRITVNPTTATLRRNSLCKSLSRVSITQKDVPA